MVTETGHEGDMGYFVVGLVTSLVTNH